MHARDILSRPEVPVRPETPLTEAIEQLIEDGFAALSVVADRDQVVGMLSESEVLAASSAVDTSIVDAVTVPVEVVRPGTGMSTIAHRMLSAGLRSIRSRRTHTGSR
ncbi:CBS domain-containing protein [Nocardia sp. NPDC005998]|uniref:CBS domain-containing protein n=1 Tax=Nocardia sp. NPDC005998 TaxID=3156894 RepID=UPI0033AA824C